MTFSGGKWNRERVRPEEMPRRVRVLGALAIVVFSVIFIRLWTLQVLSSDDYQAEAQQQRVRSIPIEAPRGDILDRNGKTLVSNRMALALQVRPEQLPRGSRRASRRRDRILDEVAGLAGLTPEQVRKMIHDETEKLPGAPVTLDDDVDYDTVYYLRENESRFPGVSVDRVYVRSYNQGTIAAQILGYVREVDAEELADPRYQELAPGDQIGKDGIEYTYDHLLRGINGRVETHVDASGMPTGAADRVDQPETGDDLYLTLDAKLQKTGEEVLGSFGYPGAFAALDVDTGEVLALGSAPTYDPALLAAPTVSKATSEMIYGVKGSHVAGPAFNRAIAGGYPTGSTFKPITALAALDAGKLTPSEKITDDDGFYQLGEQKFWNAGHVISGTQDVAGALQVSSDVFFYTLGDRLQELMDQTGKQWIQDWAGKLGFGEITGLDLPGEFDGRIPTPEWRADWNEQGLGDGRPWAVGDNVNLSVGQGDLLATPLQLAVAYAALGNGGDVVQPHIGMRAVDQAGEVVQEIAPPARRHVEIDEEWRRSVLDGLRAAAMEPGGTSYGTFGNFPVQIAGKTGTAETPYTDETGFSDMYDNAWYAALAPYDDPEIAIVLVVERAGFGADWAAPAVCRILQEYFRANLKDDADPCVGPSDGTDATVSEN